MDSSGHALGAVLSQCHSGTWWPIAFLSKSLSPTEQNYQIYDHELLMIMTSLAEWHHLLMGTAIPFEIWTDHQNLEYFRKPQKLNHRQARWVTELASYHFTLHHCPGRTHLKADILSHCPGHENGENDNEDITLLQPEVFHQLELSLEDCSFLDCIRQRSANQEQKVQCSLASNEPDWVDKNGVVTWKGRIYVPIDRHLQESVIREHHDSPLAGHLGQYQTHELVT